MLLVAFAPQVIAIRLFEGSHLTVGIALGFAQFVFFCALTWVYVRRANGEFDVLNARNRARCPEENRMTRLPHYFLAAQRGHRGPAGRPPLALAAPIWAQPRSSRSTGTPLACFLPLC